MRAVNRGLLWSIALLLVVAASARSDLIDKRTDADALVRALSAELHEKGIDALQSWESRDEYENYRSNAEAGRVVLAPLADYDVGAQRLRAEVHRQVWIDEFLAGARGALLARPGNIAEGPETDGDAFLAQWNAAAQESRVFVSYTKSDNAHAEQVAAALRAKGYVVFTYLNEDGDIKYSAETVGRAFAEAGHRYVIDSERSIDSPGVRLEAFVDRIVREKATAEAEIASGLRQRPNSGDLKEANDARTFRKFLDLGVVDAGSDPFERVLVEITQRPDIRAADKRWQESVRAVARERQAAAERIERRQMEEIRVREFRERMEHDHPAEHGL